MKRTLAATLITGGLLLLIAEAALAAAPTPPPGPTPGQIAARRACNAIADPARRGTCIANACASVHPNYRGFCTNGSAMFAAAPTPPPGPTPGQIAARRACNAIANPAARQLCITNVCNTVSPAFRGACAAGAAMFATPPPTPTVGQIAARRACNTVNPAQRGTCINNACASVSPAFRGACTAGAAMFAAGPGPTDQQRLTTLRNAIAARRTQALALCRQLFDGAQEQACIRSLFPPAPATAN